ncbi:MAG TPA: phosphoglycerate kinase [Phycisphaerales bacterium]|nr:phosphoglycerate kinase [Phycisphaerales bacterium]
MPKKTINQVDVSGKRVLMRVDFNVPLKDGKVTDDLRIRMALPSIESVLSRGGKLVLMSHLGRPKGEGFEKEFSLEPCAVRLAELLGSKVTPPGGVKFPSHDCIDGAATAAVNMLQNGECLLLENLRCHKAEQKGDAEFAKRLAAYGDMYCNDAFGTCHRADASMVAVPKAMAGKPRVCGFLVEKEIRYLSDALANPKRPFVVVLGGAKVSDKLPAIEFLLPKADAIVIGGAMAYTFLKAQGKSVGASRVEEERLGDAKKILDHAAGGKCKLYLPGDHVCAQKFEENAPDVKTFDGDIQAGWMGLDIGPKTRAEYGNVLRSAKTVVWNGPMGVFEWAKFAEGTKAVGAALVEATKAGGVTIVGGGDSAAAAEEFGIAEKLSHVSTGGGASLEMLSGKKFESVELLDEG